jgi:mono/diheme cytochrome c family protein
VACGCLVVVAGVCLPVRAETADQRAPVSDPPTPRAVLSNYCTTCHNGTRKTAGLALDGELGDVASNPQVWEKVIRKLRTEAMPPPGLPRPDRATYRATAAALEQAIDRAAAKRPDPGRLAPVHRLNRTEYQNAVRDVVGLGSMDIELLLPPDDSSYGFDNIADALWVSPSLLERYVGAAKKIARQAVGDPDAPVSSETFQLSQELAQDDRLESLPPGTRGGLVVERDFPLDGEYRFTVELGGNVRTPEPHELEIAIDGRRVHVFAIGGKGARAQAPDEGSPVVEARVPVKGGRRAVAVAFVKKTSAEPEGLLQPFLRPVGGVIAPQPAVGAVTIAGPFGTATTADTPSRRRIFTCRPKALGEERTCAQSIITTLARRAYRRPVTDDDLEVLWPFYEAGRAEAGFDRGVQRAIERLLVSPSFLFRIEQDPRGRGSVAPTSDLELASRLSFFLWSSLPDDELLDTAIRGTLRQPGVLDRQVRRMLADERAGALIANFAGQWLYLRNVEAAAPDRLLFPDFDEGLRRAFRRETELLFESILKEGRSVLDLLGADYTFVNERLARHYGIPHVYGSHFRRVPLSDSNRRGVLGHGSVLTVTSYSTRTSPVMRGKWILENLLGAPPPPPPPDVPPLVTESGSTGRKLSMREAMVQHRANPQCASCHAAMDPLGFALENFDALGRWRSVSEAGEPIDASGALPSGAKFDGAAGLRTILLADPEPFVRTVAEKLLTYALGRGVEPTDQPAIRQITAAAARDNYSLSALVRAVVASVPFQMRKGTP